MQKLSALVMIGSERVITRVPVSTSEESGTDPLSLYDNEISLQPMSNSYAVALGAISKIIDSKLLSCYSMSQITLLHDTESLLDEFLTISAEADVCDYTHFDAGVEWVYVIDTKKKRFRALCGLYDQSIAWKVLKSPKIWSKETEKEVQRQEIENYFL
ncbi:hypothetical protein HK099_006945 [Clydaea vesicula]|uniref:Uncharacterized protein n=1 Tax=Clydaea vesicula TaxID=447962 RepID=A0AAD5TX01_9FUNG|nr:hypothetical protein HK099_006945 [Clydaea vesicula]